MAAGRAKLRHEASGKKIAIGNGGHIFWCDAYQNNPYLAERFIPNETEWLLDYPGHRPYIDYHKITRVLGIRDARGRHRSLRWFWKHDHRPTPAEFFWSEKEEEFRVALSFRPPYVIIEPHIKPKAPPAKRWPLASFQRVVDELRDQVEFIQFDTDQGLLKGVGTTTANFRQAAMWLSKAKAYLGPEGGLHHAAAATNTPGVVIFGAYIPPAVTGYPIHTNLAVDEPELLGWRGEHERIIPTMNRITPQQVTDALAALL